MLATYHSKLFLNTMNKPARVTSTSATLIDHIWSNNFLNNIRNGILYTTVSDNFSIFALYGCNKIGSNDKFNDNKKVKVKVVGFQFRYPDQSRSSERHPSFLASLLWWPFTAVTS